MVARSLRYFSPRRECPFITIDLGAAYQNHCSKVNCSAMKKGLLQMPVKQNAGRMEWHQENAFFWRDRGILHLPMQSKLLTAIEKRQISRLGATDIIPIDVRLISATNVNIRQLVEEGNFRQDLLYRINTIEIAIPPLRKGRGCALIG